MRSQGPLSVPLHLRTAVTPLQKEWGYGRGYKYPHAYRGGYVKQDIYMQGYSVINGLIRKLFYDKDVYPEIYNTAFDSDSYSESGHERNEQNGSV